LVEITKGTECSSGVGVGDGEAATNPHLKNATNCHSDPESFGRGILLWLNMNIIFFIGQQ
jgi:hypothetical protein